LYPGDAPANPQGVLIVVRFPDREFERPIHFDAVVGADGQPDGVFAIAQATWRAVEGKAAADRIRPVRERGTDVLTRKSAMSIPQKLVVQVDPEFGDPGPGQEP